MTLRRSARAALLAPLVLSAFALPAALSPAHAQVTDGTAADITGDEPVSLRFAVEIGGEPFACGQSYTGIGRTEGAVAVTDFRLFVSELALIGADGQRVPVALDDDGRWQDGQVALLDFENGRDRCDNGTGPVNAQVSAQAPAGDYTGVEFVIGVPFDSNHGDPTLAGSPLNLTSMFWNWRGGYRFLKVDMVPVGGMAAHGEAPAHGEAVAHGGAMAEGKGTGHGGKMSHGAAPAGAWMLHLGSTGCTSTSRTSAPPEPCAQPNRVTVEFDAFDAASDLLVIDPAALLADSDLGTNTPDTSPGCMSFPGDADCAGVLPRAGLAYGDLPGGEQQLVTVRSGAR